MATFKSLQKTRKKNLQKLQSQLEKDEKPSYIDDRFWKPTVDKAGNGFALIRFLPVSPADPEDSLPWVRYWDHFFRGPGGGVYSELSLTTLGEKDPCSEMNSSLWNTGIQKNKDLISFERKRRLKYVANIYIVKDPSEPDNEGKVFLFRFGKKIYDKIDKTMRPDEDPIDPKEPFNPFDLWEGANFSLKVRKKDGYTNYDDSKFATPGPLLDDDKALEEIWQKEYSIQEFVAPDKFKTYDELKTRLHEVLAEIGGNSEKTAESTKISLVDNDDTQTTEEPATPTTDEENGTIEEDADDSLDFYNKLANDE